MHAADRYFCESTIMGDKAVLSGQEAHHLINVMRGGPGTRVVLFDGSGWEYSAQVEQIGRTEATLAILGRQEVDRELPIEIHLGVSLPKGDRQKWLVEKSVELGVGRLIPLKTARSVAQPVEQALARLKRTVIEASKQCGRNRLMEISEPQDWGDFAAGVPADGLRLLAHPDPGGRGAASPHDRSKKPAAAASQAGGCRAAGPGLHGRRSRRGLCGRRGRPGPHGGLAAGRSGPPHLADRDGRDPAGGDGLFRGRRRTLAAVSGQGIG